jgi:hypothetical protein
VLAGQSHIALAACDVALVASGTATLEAALFKKPMVITYRVPALTAQLMRKQALLPWIGLPNILARDFVVPERVQEAATPDNLAADALAWLANSREAFDLIFVDPPFDSGLAGQVLPELGAHLKSGGQAYVEQGTAVIAPPGFIIHRSGRAGRSHFALLIKD